MRAEFKPFVRGLPDGWHGAVKASGGYAELIMTKYDDETIGRVHVEVVFDEGMKRVEAIRAGLRIAHVIEEFIP
jgi:hypothetical protein